MLYVKKKYIFINDYIILFMVNFEETAFQVLRALIKQLWYCIVHG